MAARIRHIALCVKDIKANFQGDHPREFRRIDDERAKRNILGLNSARLYGLRGSESKAGCDDEGVYKQGRLANYAVHMQPGSAIDTALRGVGYPTPVKSASLLPQDKLTGMRKQYAEMGGARSNTRFGWMRTKG